MMDDGWWMMDGGGWMIDEVEGESGGEGPPRPGGQQVGMSVVGSSSRRRWRRRERNGDDGAIAMGHPLGATGAMILGTVLDELERTNKSTALATLCVGGGMGTATVIERV